MVRAAATRPALIEARGRPPRLTTTFMDDGPVDPFCEMHLDIPQGADGWPPLMAQILPAGPGRLHLLTFLVPDWIPPSTYRGDVVIRNVRRPLAVEVEPHLSLLLLPARHDATVPAGAEMLVRLSVVNTGNVEFELGGSHAVTLTDAHTIDRIVSRAALTTLKAGESRIQRIGEELAAIRGGVATVRVHEGHGAIPPGEAREVRAALKVPDRLAPGRTYLGTWHIGNAAFTLRITALTGPRHGREDPSERSEEEAEEKLPVSRKRPESKRAAPAAPRKRSTRT